jgi:hypothetical protein
MPVQDLQGVKPAINAYLVGTCRTANRSHHDENIISPLLRQRAFLWAIKKDRLVNVVELTTRFTARRSRLSREFAPWKTRLDACVCDSA